MSTSITTTDPLPTSAAIAPADAVAPFVYLHPALDENRTKLSLPVDVVTLLEDRAQVRRQGRIALAPGRHRLSVWEVAPVLQDVSLQVTTSTAGARVDDARVRRAFRITHAERPEAARTMEDALEALVDRYREAYDDAERLQQRRSVVATMITHALDEIPEDAAWSIGDVGSWQKTFESLSATSAKLLVEAQSVRTTMEELQAEIDIVQQRRQRLDRPDTNTIAVLELDVVVDGTGGATVDVELIAEYTVPNALWRPTHEATLQGDRLQLRSQAAVWQNTGEDWSNAQLNFSTARSSLGHDPPLLRDDVLQVKKKDQRVVVEAREVAIQKAGQGRGGGGSPAPSGVDLPGVDDGGDIQLLKAKHRIDLPSTGEPAFVPLFEAEAAAKRSLVIIAEHADLAFVKAIAPHTGDRPLLAGPVALLRDSGPVGHTTTLFVAPGENIVLGFGPDDDVRVQRSTDSEEETDEIDHWRRRTVTIGIYVSNLGNEAKQLEIVERIPVSEIEHVKVTLQADRTSGAPRVDDDGLVHWEMELAPRGRLRLNLVYTIAFAPAVSTG